jgi:alpha-L-fucosidase
MRIILYYSQPDWHHKAFVHLPGAFKDLQYRRPDDEPNWPLYREYVHGQVRELVTSYGPIDGIWFDGSHKSVEAWGGRELYAMIKEHQPHAVVNDRGRYGDYFTPERSLPEDLTGYLFEACESLTTRYWGWSPDSGLHNVPHLLDSLVRMAGSDGNYLLNISPKPDGTLPEDQVARLRAMGDWLRTNGEAIYGTVGQKLADDDDNLRFTRSGNRVYVIMRHWPTTNQLNLPAIGSTPTMATLLAGGDELTMDATEELQLCGLPMEPPDANPQVVRLEFDDEPELEPRVVVPPEPRTIRVNERGATTLTAADAASRGLGVKGAHLRLRDGVITGWQAPEQTAVWSVNAVHAGRYDVRIHFRCAPLYAGSTFTLQAGDERIEGVVEGHEPETEFYRQEVGAIELPVGETRLVLAPVEMPYGYIFADVEAIELQPA